MYKYEEGISIVDCSMIENCVCEDVYPEELPEIRKLGEAMIKLCLETGGLGLAAPQVGIMKKMFIWNNAHGQFQIIVNPSFTPSGKRTNVVEGCLSYPGKNFLMKRFKEGKAKFSVLDPKEPTKFKNMFKSISGEKAFIWQHESDHLLGKTISTCGVEFGKPENNVKSE